METQERKTVLMVEDDTAISQALERRFAHHGLRCVTAADAATATSTARHDKPDVAVLDICMPAGDGFDVAERLRKNISPDLPLIFLTASKRPEHRRRAASFRPVAFFDKPFQADELIAAVGSAL